MKQVVAFTFYVDKRKNSEDAVIVFCHFASMYDKYDVLNVTDLANFYDETQTVQSICNC